LTIRLRLTLLFTALLAGVGLIWCVGLVGGLWFTLGRMAEHDVRDKVHVISDYLHDLDAEERLAGRPLDLTSFDALPHALSDDGMYLQLTAPDGTPFNRSPNLGDRRLPLPARPGLAPIAIQVPRFAEPRRVLLVTQPLTLPERGTLGWVQVAYPLDGHGLTVTRFAVLAGVSWLLFVSAAWAMAYFFTGRALAPVVAMTEGVRRMRATDLPWRLPVAQPPQDEIERLGATFNELFERLEIAFDAKRRFVADASHELKSPLTSILGYLRLIRVRGPGHPAEIPGWAEAAARETARLERLVESLLVLARTGEGKLTLERVSVDLAAIARQVVAEFQVRTPRVSFRSGDAAAWILGDPDRLKQIVINLVDNAVRATRDAGEVQVEVTTLGDQVRLVVADTGVGMAPEVLPRIFDRFYRADAARDRAQGGTGLGLAITAALVEDHQGHIEVTSTEGVGSRFSVTLPAGDAPPG
jgi:signal transduction histidine kinase